MRLLRAECLWLVSLDYRSVKYYEHSRFPFSLGDRTSVANVATRARDIGGTADCSRVHSTKSFLFSALTSCSTESSRTGSRDMVVAINPGLRHSWRTSSRGFSVTRYCHKDHRKPYIASRGVHKRVSHEIYIDKNVRQPARPSSGQIRW